MMDVACPKGRVCPSFSHRRTLGYGTTTTTVADKGVQEIGRQDRVSTWTNILLSTFF